MTVDASESWFEKGEALDHTSRLLKQHQNDIVPQGGQQKTGVGNHIDLGSPEHGRVAHLLHLAVWNPRCSIQNIFRLLPPDVLEGFEVATTEEGEGPVIDCWLEVSDLAEANSPDNLARRGYFDIPKGGLSLVTGTFRPRVMHPRLSKYVYLLCRVAVGRPFCVVDKDLAEVDALGEAPSLPQNFHSFYVQSSTGTDSYSHTYRLLDSSRILPTHLVTFYFDPRPEAIIPSYARCDVCDDNEAVWYCHSDDANLCDDCDTNCHGSSYLVAKHHRVKIVDNRRKGIAGTCSRHPNVPVDHFCMDCFIPVCVHCKVVGDHSKGDAAMHKLLPVSEAYRMACDTIYTGGGVNEEFKRGLADRLAMVQRKIKSVQRNVELTQDLIREIGRAAFSDLRSVSMESTQKIKQIQLDMMRREQTIDWVDSFVSLAMKKFTPVDFVQMWALHRRFRKEFIGMDNVHRIYYDLPNPSIGCASDFRVVSDAARGFPELEIDRRPFRQILNDTYMHSDTARHFIKLTLEQVEETARLEMGSLQEGGKGFPTLRGDEDEMGLDSQLGEYDGADDGAGGESTNPDLHPSVEVNASSVGEEGQLKSPASSKVNVTSLWVGSIKGLREERLANRGKWRRRVKEPTPGINDLQKTGYIPSKYQELRRGGFVKYDLSTQDGEDEEGEGQMSPAKAAEQLDRQDSAWNRWKVTRRAIQKFKAITSPRKRPPKAPHKARSELWEKYERNKERQDELQARMSEQPQKHRSADRDIRDLRQRQHLNEAAVEDPEQIREPAVPVNPSDKSLVVQFPVRSNFENRVPKQRLPGTPLTPRNLEALPTVTTTGLLMPNQSNVSGGEVRRRPQQLTQRTLSQLQKSESTTTHTHTMEPSGSPETLSSYGVHGALAGTGTGGVTDPAAAQARRYTRQIAGDDIPEHIYSSKFDPLLQVLVENDYAVVWALGASVDTRESDELSKALVEALHPIGVLMDLIGTMVRQETEACESEAVLFRNNTITTKVIKHFFTRIGQSYLKSSLGTVVEQILSDGLSYEVDPSRLQQGEDLEANKRRLKLACEAFFDVISTSVDVAPVPMKQVCTHVTEAVCDRFPASRYTSIGGFFILRFISPAILTPEAFGIVPNPPAPARRRALLLISKILTTLVNNATFGKKEEYLEPFNALFLADNSSKLPDMYDRLCAITEDNSIFESDVHRSEVDANLFVLTQKLHAHLDSLGRQLPSHVSQKVATVVKTLVSER